MRIYLLRRSRSRAVRPRPYQVVAALAAALVISSCQASQPAALEGIGESVLQLGDAISTLQLENAMLQEQLDSLRIAVARQDTTLRMFANLAGMPLP
jgi:hypothetical protein